MPQSKNNLNTNTTNLDHNTVSRIFKLIISEKAYLLIKDLHIEGVEFFQTYAITKDEHKHSYFLGYPYRNCTEVLDYSSCEFSISSINEFNGDKLEICSSEDFQDKYYSLRAEQKGTIRIDKIVLANDTRCDLFCLGYVTEGGIGYYISENLKKQFETAGLTGLEYTLVG